MMTLDEARARLRDRITPRCTMTQLANEIGCGIDFLSHVLAGRKSFGLKYALVIQRKFRIPASAWISTN